jgi:threonine/homoserine/homoserine lactone efflux protein
MFITIIAIVLLIHGSYAFVALRMRDGLIGIKARKYMARFSGVSFLGFGMGLVYESQK